ncbi:MAG: hypothetical protein NUV67_06185 [archaeon]|nr:hypothetical protein [archaeon]
MAHKGPIERMKRSIQRRWGSRSVGIPQNIPPKAFSSLKQRGNKISTGKVLDGNMLQLHRTNELLMGGQKHLLKDDVVVAYDVKGRFVGVYNLKSGNIFVNLQKLIEEES